MKDFIYYSIRLPGAIQGLLLALVAFAPDLEATGPIGISETLIRIASLLIGVFILIPNHKWLSQRLYFYRICAMAILGIGSLFWGIEMLMDYQAGGKDSAMVPIAIFFLYNAFALPSSVWMRKVVPDA